MGPQGDDPGEQQEPERERRSLRRGIDAADAQGQKRHRDRDP